MTAIALAFVAGLLSILSPCVLPLVPIVLGAAVAQHRHGPLALAAGLALSFTLIGLLVAVAGFSLGLDAGVFRAAAAVIMIALGAVLLVPAAQVRLAAAGSPLSGLADQYFGQSAGAGLAGQFGIGLLLGAVWSPCVGPTLGAASLLASQGRDLATVAMTMAAFGIGAALPLVGLGLLSRATLTNIRGRLLSAGKLGKAVLGGAFVVIGIAILSGADKRIEAALVAVSPAWLTNLTTRF
ncbi:cytochrome c biogenesis transmembrane protein [Rhodopseudomonas thermotolerans]|uniref:Cytochrome c biogenesis transmembrane protein n=2 Tax=Rhodopseudomonas TaxID=1073 RepID=A0A336JWA7_9BRAD|nr:MULTISPECIES: cytochrome c biogenesis protein CcdA [Rhodopseudomonas]RED21717.1 cytochrome c biogenesis transmembrane protein [Rhodopseudomonas pentothenatexigens]REF88625.1 cytochrome c biogenesis transmembrane protein [Rhodopseudomonas thermotolerans]SSW93598.1 cytochrome c biogenesis transmembrane protein [Rhodopseudomonas pentothenatexigens]